MGIRVADKSQGIIIALKGVITIRNEIASAHILNVDASIRKMLKTGDTAFLGQTYAHGI